MRCKIFRITPFDDAPIADEFHYVERRVKDFFGYDTMAWVVEPKAGFPIPVEGESLPDDARITAVSNHLFFDSNDLALRVESDSYPEYRMGDPMLCERSCDMRRKP